MKDTKNMGHASEKYMTGEAGTVEMTGLGDVMMKSIGGDEIPVWVWGTPIEYTVYYVLSVSHI